MLKNKGHDVKVMCDSGLDLGPEKGHQWDNQQNVNRVYRFDKSTVYLIY